MSQTHTFLRRLSLTSSGVACLRPCQPALNSVLCQSFHRRHFARSANETKDAKKRALLLKRFPDPQRPTRLDSAYIRFVRQTSAKSDFQLRDNMPAIAEQWNKLSDSAKAKYNPTESERQASEKAMSDYKGSVRPSKWLAKVERLSKEKPPVSGYSLFVKAWFAKNQTKGTGVKASDSMKKISVDWKKLTDSQRTEYNTKAKTAYDAWRKKITDAAL